jgi:hypothetical protein
MLADRLSAELKVAMKERAADRVGVIRLMLADLKNARIQKGSDLTADDEIAVLKRATKMRVEASEQFRRGGRADLAAKEEREIELLRAYLPEPITGEALAALVDDAIRRAGATSAKDMGAVMKLVLGEHGSQVNGKDVQALVRARLGG